MKSRFCRRLISVLIAGLLFAGCRHENPVTDSTAGPVLYCSVDETFAREVVERYRQQTGVAVVVVTDSEAGKTTGLVNRIIAEAEAGRSRADVFWSSELFNTILLARRGFLEPYDSPAAADIPARYKDVDHRWTAMSERARVLAFVPGTASSRKLPQRWEELSEPRFAKQVALANPLFGTTRGHLAAMFALWGRDRARSFLVGLRDGGAFLADGNSAAVRAVLAGRAQLAATDSDDVWVARRSGVELDLCYPDMGDGGTLLIPCSVALIRGCRHPAAGRQLIDYLVSIEVERLLAQSDSQNIPVRDALRSQLGMARPPASRVDFGLVADSMEEAVASCREILLR